jgi:hypothetical protein
VSAPEVDHEDGRHIHQLVKGCAGCERIRPDVERTQETVRYITRGQAIRPPRGWRSIPMPGPVDFEAICVRVEEEAWDLGPDDEPGEWSP